MDTFPDEVKRDMEAVFHGYCHGHNCYEKIHSFHHKLKNTPYNRKRYPLFMQSPFNCFPSCEKGHIHYADKKITPELAMVYENYLRRIMTDMPFTTIETNGRDDNGNPIRYDIK